MKTNFDFTIGKWAGGAKERVSRHDLVFNAPMNDPIYYGSLLAINCFYKTGGGLIMELTYTKHGDYYLPDLEIPAQEKVAVNRYGQMHGDYLKKNNWTAYNELLFSGRLRFACKRSFCNF